MEATPPGEERRRRRLTAPTLAEMQDAEAEEGARGRLEAVITELARSQRALQEAVVELCRLAPRDGSRRTPRDALTKMTADDDVEAYLQVFERAAHREEWPQADWAAILAPFLMGEAQQAYQDMAVADATDYLKLRRAILARYGFSLPARAQRYHDWSYDASQPAWSQVAALTRLTRSWLAEEDGPPLLERVVLDRCTRALPKDAKRYVAQMGPASVELLVGLLENHQVTQKMLQSERTEPQSRPTRGPQPVKHPPARPDPNRRGRPDAGRPRPEWRCYNCGEAGHLARCCPGKEVSMPTASGGSSPPHPCLYLTTCWAHQSTEAPRFPVRVGGQDTEAVLDSGSAITLLRPDFAGEQRGEEVAVECIHGDTRKYPTVWVDLITPRGTHTVRAGVVPNLPVPVLMGRDCPLFQTYWEEGPRPLRETRPRRPQRAARQTPLPVWAATSGDSEGEALPPETERQPSAPATFQRLMDQVLRPHQRYAAAYLDDIVIHSTDWDSHVDKIEAMLMSLREAGLTANPAKCRLGLKEAAYLGHTVGRGRVKPQSNKVDSIATWPQPAMKKQVRMFLGLVGYYRQFIPEFAARAAPLHDLTKKEQPNRVQWNPLAAAAFQDLRPL
ncbi:uncharacterized protein LOC133134426 [Conger conger]|uniref:uncharacterized protein LOC133134426 n=1 Tax=Conger conger TaxID=82655 RepID=UPI002A5AB62A|nr:uncharacterized protein LOC133134426 [Conger conger]